MNAEEYRKILSVAISREVESYAFYRAVQERVEDKDLKLIFEELAGDETSHRELLEGYLSRPAKSLSFDVTSDYKVSESFDTPTVTIDMKPAEGLQLAIKKEKEAVEMYTRLARMSTGSEQKGIFENLAKMELGHKTKLEDIYTNMAFPEVW